ncbi:MAG: Clp protease ClpP [Cycloclasticus sp.]|nr:Clp protease ClpP [Cycloclasticus sp.]
MKRNQVNARMVAGFWGKDLKEPNNWYAMNVVGDTAEIRIYDIIGWPFVDADTFLNELSNIQQNKILVRINSPGGDVFDGMAIYNALKDHPAQITTRIEGIAASMASIIALAGDADKRQIAKSASYMIHNPWSFYGGDYREAEKAADLMKRLAAQLAEIYADATGAKQADIQALMDSETWFFGKEAVESSFMSNVSDKGAAQTAKFDLSMFAHAPKSTEPTKRDLERTLTQDAGLSRSQARQLLHGGFESLATQDASDDKAVSAVQNLLNTIKG